MSGHNFLVKKKSVNSFKLLFHRLFDPHLIWKFLLPNLSFLEITKMILVLRNFLIRLRSKWSQKLEFRGSRSDSKILRLRVGNILLMKLLGGLCCHVCWEPTPKLLDLLWPQIIGHVIFQGQIAEFHTLGHRESWLFRLDLELWHKLFLDIWAKIFFLREKTLLRWDSRRLLVFDLVISQISSKIS